jgi:pimeloyl-ACP methyl ester carboxylesterase
LREARDSRCRIEAAGAKIPDMPFVEAGGTRLYYETHGPKPGAAPAIVFAHGAGGNHLSWWQQVPHFRDRYTCVVFDHRGFGQSPDAPDGPAGAAFVDDLRALLDHLAIERATLVAQSMGGWTCLNFAHRYPERVERLMMCDTHGGMRSPEIDALWAEAMRNRVEPGEVHPAAGERMYREQPGLHFLYQEISALNPSVGLSTMRDVPSIAAVDVVALNVPMLFIAGEEDIVIPPQIVEIASSHVPSARFKCVPQCGHSVYFERAEILNALLQDFLRTPASRS